MLMVRRTIALLCSSSSVLGLSCVCSSSSASFWMEGGWGWTTSREDSWPESGCSVRLDILVDFGGGEFDELVGETDRARLLRRSSVAIAGKQIRRPEEGSNGNVNKCPETVSFCLR